MNRITRNKSRNRNWCGTCGKCLHGRELRGAELLEVALEVHRERAALHRDEFELFALLPGLAAATPRGLFAARRHARIPRFRGMGGWFCPAR